MSRFPGFFDDRIGTQSSSLDRAERRGMNSPERTVGNPGDRPRPRMSRPADQEEPAAEPGPRVIGHERH